MAICGYCNKEFLASNYQKRQLKAGKIIFCSASCGTKFRSDKNKISEDIINKIRYFINETNLNYTQIRKEVNLSITDFNKVLEEYNLKRSKERVDELKQLNMKKTMKERYGVENSMEVKEFRDKISESHSQRSLDQKLETKNKRRNTNFKKYGDENYHNFDKALKTMKEKYGYTCGFQSNDAIAKRRQTSLEKYGVDNPLKSEEIRNKGRKIILQKYGYKSSFSSPLVRAKINNTNKQRYGNINPFRNKDLQNKQHNTLQERYGVSYGCQTPNCINSSSSSKSKLNMRLEKFLEADKTELPLDNYRYDIVKGLNLIELDPTVTHNNLHTPYGSPKDKNYHLDKTMVAIKYNYRCIHIFDWDDWDKIKYLIQDKESIYARNLRIQEVNIDEASNFLNEYHLQGTCRGQKIRLGLYKEDQLIQIMTFGKPRYTNKYEYELLRLCTHKNYKVIGGSEKLFKYFIKNYNPKSIISYCDYSKFTGEVYLKLGFKRLSLSGPAKHWSKNKAHITDNLLRQRGYDQLFGTNYGKGTSNEELMIENGWLPVYDCGQLTFIWINKNM